MSHVPLISSSKREGELRLSENPVHLSSGVKHEKYESLQEVASEATIEEGGKGILMLKRYRRKDDMADKEQMKMAGKPCEGLFIEKTGRTPPTSKVGDECHFFKCEK